MKQNQIKTYLKLGILLFGMVVVITACQKEESIANHNYLPKLKIETLNRPDFSNNRKLFGKLSALKNNNATNSQNNTQGRPMNMEEYGLVIDDEVVKHITYGTYESYTFYIISNEDNGKVKNLLLSKELNGNYKASIVSYDLSNQEQQDLGSGIIPSNLSQKTTIYPVGSESNGGFIRMDANGNCYFIDQVWYENGVLYWSEVQRPCPEHLQQDDITGGGSSSNSGTDNTDPDNGDPGDNNPPDDSEDPNNGNDPYDGNVGGGPNNNTGNTDNTGNTNDGNNTENTDQIDDCLETDENGNCIGDITIPIGKNSNIQDNNIQKLNTLTQDSIVKAKIIELKGKTSENREYGYQFNVSPNNPNTYNFVEGELALDNQGIKFPTASIYTQLEVHTHYDGLDNAFSASDLYNTAKLITEGNPDAASMLVAPNGKLFALKSTDQSKTNEFKIYNEQVGEEEMKKHYYRYVIRWAQVTCNGCTVTEFENLITNYLIYYLTQIWESGLTLYEATEDSDGNIAWTEVIYTP